MFRIHRDATWATVLDSMSREHIQSETFDATCPAGMVLKALCEQFARAMNNAVEAADDIQVYLQRSLESGSLTGGLGRNSRVSSYDEAMAALQALNSALMPAAMAYVQTKTLPKVDA